VLPGPVPHPGRDPEGVLEPHEPPDVDVRATVGPDGPDAALEGVAECRSQPAGVLGHRASAPIASWVRVASAWAAAAPSTAGSSTEVASPTRARTSSSVTP